MSENGRGARDERSGKLDRALDAALRQMAGGEGPADMRRRVLARLAEPPRRIAPRWVVLAAAGGIALALATAAVLRRPPGPAPSTSVARPDLSQPVPPLSPPSGPTGSRGSAQTAPLAVRPVPPPTARTQAPEWVTSAGVEKNEVDMEPIEPAPLAVAPMETERMTVAPLRVEPMQVEPLAEPKALGGEERGNP